MIPHKVAHAYDLMFTPEDTFFLENGIDKELLAHLTDSLDCFESQMALYSRVNLHVNGKHTRDATDRLAIQISIKWYLSLNDTSAVSCELRQFNNKQQFYFAWGGARCQLFYSNETIIVSLGSSSYSSRYFPSLFVPFFHIPIILMILLIELDPLLLLSHIVPVYYYLPLSQCIINQLTYEWFNCLCFTRPVCHCTPIIKPAVRSHVLKCHSWERRAAYGQYLNIYRND